MKKIIDSKLQFLDGPDSRGSEFGFSLKVFAQFIKGFRKLHFIGPAITVFGSARFSSENVYYKKAYEIGRELAGMGMSVMTGGGPGIMEAANRGCYEHGGYSVGCTIVLPEEQSENPYMHKSVQLDYFFVRKVLLLKYSYAFIVMPGGFGTIDELFETLTLIQTGILHNFPIVVFGLEYYKEVILMINKMIKAETISETDKDLLLFTDDISLAMSHIRKFIDVNYKVKLKKKKPLWWLGEN